MHGKKLVHTIFKITNRKKHMKRILTILMLGATLGAVAQTPLMENFSYSTGQLTALNTGANVSGGNWINFSGTGAALTVASPGLTYSGYTATGIGNMVTMVATSTSAEDAYRAFGTSYTSGEFYATFMINVTDTARLLANTSTTGDYFMSFLPASSTTALNDRLSIRKGASGNTFNLGIRTSSGMAAAVWSSADYTPGVTYLIAIRHIIVTGTSNDSTFLFVNPALTTTIATPVVATAQSGTASDLTDFSRFALRQGTGTPNVSVDGIRIANSWVNSVLPVTLTNFKGTKTTEGVTLNWSTSTETNNKGFEVESSINGTDFETIGFVAGKGTSNRLNQYSFNHNNELGATYFRLKQIDVDGEFSYSETIRITNEEISIEITPNPFSDKIVISSENKEMPVVAEVFDMSGKSKVISQGIGNVNIQTSELAEGVYFIRINHGEKVSIHRIIKN